VAYEGRRNAYRKNSEETGRKKDYLESLGVNVRIILKWILK
jgi:hypothetical protein